jgi:acetyl esterase/lipase
MSPEAYFPAAVDDAVALHKEALKTTNPKNIAFFGTSAGGALALEMVLRAREKGSPLPGAGLPRSSANTWVIEDLRPRRPSPAPAYARRMTGCSVPMATDAASSATSNWF